MKQYLVPKQLVNLSPRDSEILRLLGIDFSEFNPAPEQLDTKLSNLDFSVRTYNILRSSGITNLTISEFVTNFSERDLIRYRGCGKKTIREINNTIYPYGFKLRKGHF